MQLQEFKKSYQELLLNYLWDQWASLGVAGYSESNESSRVIDPEALLLFSFSIARYDQRLFDEILDWLNKNERFINVQRLRNILKKESFCSGGIMRAIAQKMKKKSSGRKWKGLVNDKSMPGETKPKALFFLKTGAPLPVAGNNDPEFYRYGYIRNMVQHRGLSRFFPPGKRASLLLQLRGLFGLNSRAEILLYLIVNEKGTIQEIANQSYYAWRSVQDVLFELGSSGIVKYPLAKKGRIYNLNAESWRKLLLGKTDYSLRWICWPPLFRALEIIWETINKEALINSSKLEQIAEMRVTMDKKLFPLFQKSGFGSAIKEASSYWEDDYLELWLENIQKILHENETVGR